MIAACLLGFQLLVDGDSFSDAAGGWAWPDLLQQRTHCSVTNQAKGSIPARVRELFPAWGLACVFTLGPCRSIAYYGNVGEHADALRNGRDEHDFEASVRAVLDDQRRVGALRQYLVLGPVVATDPDARAFLWKLRERLVAICDDGTAECIDALHCSMPDDGAHLRTPAGQRCLERAVWHHLREENERAQSNHRHQDARPAARSRRVREDRPNGRGQGSARDVHAP